MIEVTQADRLAAAQIYQRFRDHDYAKWIGDGTNAGGDFDTVIQAFARHRIAAENASHQEITALRARIAELEQRLEIDPAHPYDGIETRDATIIALETYKENLRDEVVELRAKIAELEAERAEWVEVERLRIGKATPPTPPV